MQEMKFHFRLTGTEEELQYLEFILSDFFENAEMVETAKECLQKFLLQMREQL